MFSVQLDKNEVVRIGDDIYLVATRNSRFKVLAPRDKYYITRLGNVDVMDNMERAKMIEISSENKEKNGR